MNEGFLFAWFNDDVETLRTFDFLKCFRKCFSTFGSQRLSPLTAAIDDKLFHTTMWLIDNSQDLEKEDEYGRTPLCAAACFTDDQTFRFECMNALLVKGASVSRPCRALSIALNLDYDREVRLLLAHGATMNHGQRRWYPFQERGRLRCKKAVVTVLCGRHSSFVLQRVGRDMCTLISRMLWATRFDMCWMLLTDTKVHG